MNPFAPSPRRKHWMEPRPHQWWWAWLSLGLFGGFLALAWQLDSQTATTWGTARWAQLGASERIEFSLLYGLRGLSPVVIGFLLVFRRATSSALTISVLMLIVLGCVLYMPVSLVINELRLQQPPSFVVEIASNLNLLAAFLCPFGVLVGIYLNNWCLTRVSRHG